MKKNKWTRCKRMSDAGIGQKDRTIECGMVEKESKGIAIGWPMR